MMGMCEATKPDDVELVNVAKSYRSMNDSRTFSSETANDDGMYIFLSAPHVRPQPRMAGRQWTRLRLAPMAPSKGASLR
jgi:hypothetical protein